MPKIALLCFSSNTAMAIAKQLRRLLGTKFTIDEYSWNSLPPSNMYADLIVYTSPYAYAHLHEYVRNGIPYRIVRRSINYHEIAPLFKLKKHEPALLVNDSQESAHQTIRQLQLIGLDHIDYFPYYPGARDYPSIKVAITPSETQLVPKGIKQVININTRLVDITSVMDIINFFDLANEYANTISARYIHDIIDLMRAGSHLLQESSYIKERLQAVISNVHDGLVAFDKNDKITVFNEVAEFLLNRRANLVIGRSADKVFPSSFLPQLKKLTSESLRVINGREILVSTSKVGDDHITVLKDVSEIHRLEDSVRRRLQQEQNIARYNFSDIVGSSVAVKQAQELAKKMANSEAAILIHGESGTGKELFAQSIHNASRRRHGPFVAINFAALSEHLLESELFGYEEGSFTGARRGGAAGLFEAANKGTLFLDEVGDAPLSFQVKLLRVLQERQIRRVGSVRVIPIDVRIIAATNCNLKELIQKKLFRQDLYYRLNVLPLEVPSLRQRNSDVLPLCHAFYQHYFLSEPAEQYFAKVGPYLAKYNWPGNIRELQNVVEYLTSICPDRAPEYADLPSEVREQLSSNENDNTALVEAVYQEILRCNQQKIPVGRRSLANTFCIAESRMRLILNELRKLGKITIGSGRFAIIAQDN